MDVIEELKFLGKFTKKKIRGGGGGGFFSPENLLIVLYKLQASTYNTFRDITFAKLQSTKFKKGQ